jgi:hypothetical protein
MPPETEERVWTEETVKIRFDAAKGAGMTDVEAQMFAESTIPRKELRKLQRLNCPPEYVARILL